MVKEKCSSTAVCVRGMGKQLSVCRFDTSICTSVCMHVCVPIAASAIFSLGCVCVCVSDCLHVSTAWPRYRVMRVSDLGQYNLEILSADLSDDSLYECQAPDAALRSRRAKLTVLSKPVCVFVCVYILATKH